MSRITDSWKEKEERKFLTPMLTAALFTVAKRQEEPECVSGDEWTKKV